MSLAGRPRAALPAYSRLGPGEAHGPAPSHRGRRREGQGTRGRRPPSLLAFPRRPRCAQRRRLNLPLGTAGVERPERRRRRPGPGGGGRARGPRGHSPARAVVDVFQHRVPEEGAGGALEAHGALRVQVVGAGGGSRGHQRQEQRAEPPGAPPRRRAAHPPPTPPSRCPASRALSAPAAGRRGPDGRRLPGRELCARTPGRCGARPGPWAERAREASTRAAGAERAASSVRPTSLRARTSRSRAPRLWTAERRARRVGGGAAGRGGSAPCGPRAHSHLRAEMAGTAARRLGCPKSPPCPGRRPRSSPQRHAMLRPPSRVSVGVSRSLGPHSHTRTAGSRGRIECMLWPGSSAAPHPAVRQPARGKHSMSASCY